MEDRTAVCCNTFTIVFLPAVTGMQHYACCAPWAPLASQNLRQGKQNSGCSSLTVVFLPAAADM